MKCIFIDIDGPLSWATWDQGQVKIADGIWHDFTIPYPWVKEDCAALAEIVEKTGASIVVSSDWKLHFGLAQLKIIFQHYGINRHDVIDVTPSHNTRRKMSQYHAWDRACQIQSWVKAFKPKHWIAIDDLQIGDCFRQMRIPKWRHIQVDGDHGTGGRLRDKIEECVTKLTK